MRNKNKLLVSFLVIVLTLHISLLYPKIVYADSIVARLTLHAYGDSLAPSGGRIGQGHAFLTIYNKTKNTLNFLDYPIEPKKMISLSIWPDTRGYAGVHINREMVVSKGLKTTSISVNITQSQLDTIAKKTPKESYYHDGLQDFIVNPINDIWHNCTTYSTKMWNAVVPKKMRISDGIFGIDAPKLVAKEIRKKSGYKETVFTHNQKLDWSDVFYVSKKKEMVPYKVNAPSVTISKKTTSSITLKWTSSAKKLLNQKKNRITYRISYREKNKTFPVKQTITTSTNTIIKGLKSNTEYAIVVKAIYTDGSLTDHGDSKILTVRTKHKNKTTIALSVSSKTLRVGGSFKLKASVTGSSKKVSWSSSNRKVATVSNGTVKAVQVGTANIVAKINGIKATCKVTVMAQDTYLEDLPVIETGQYDGNQGDSFIYTIGKHQYTRGNEDISGTKYSHGLEAWIARWNYTPEISWAYSVYKLDKKYKKLEGRIVLLKSYNTTDFNSTLYLYSDGRLIATYQLRPDTIPFDFSFNMSNVKNLKIKVADNVAVSGGTSFGLVECKLTAK